MRILDSLLMLTLAACCQLSFAEDKTVPFDDPISATQTTFDETITQPITIGPQRFRSVTGLAKYIEDKISTYFTQIEGATQYPELQAALAIADTKLLPPIENRLKTLLPDSIKVRLYPNGLEEVDNYSTPACGFACINIAINAYTTSPPAEALLYDTPDANITLARAVFSEAGQAMGVVVVHYPYELITESIKRLANTGIYTEFQQQASGEKNILQKHGNIRTRQGKATRIIRLKGTRWHLAVWTPGGVKIDEYEPPSIQWSRIALGIVVLIVGITLLILYKKKYPFSVKISKSD